MRPPETQQVTQQVATEIDKLKCIAMVEIINRELYEGYYLFPDAEEETCLMLIFNKQISEWMSWSDMFWYLKGFLKGKT